MNKYHPLKVVATPIGNLQEVSVLAKKTLSEAQTIICEDTRVTKKLLQLLDIKHQQKLISYNKVTEYEKTAKILAILEQEPCVLVSDAGYPIISDPGFHLLKTLRQLQSRIQVINGPCALIHALVGSGIDSRKFFFANFLTKKRVQRIKELQKMRPISYLSTIVYYEPLNFLQKGLEILSEVFGDIEIGVARELTKLNETFYYGPISQLLVDVEMRGEFVIIIPRQEEPVAATKSLEDILKQIDQAVALKIKLKQACKDAETSEWKASFLYKEYIEWKTKNK